MVCTYKFFADDKIWRIQNFEISPFWCTELIHAPADDHCFIPPFLVQHSMHSITTYPVILYSKINTSYIWIIMGVLSVTYNVYLITRLDCD